MNRGEQVRGELARESILEVLEDMPSASIRLIHEETGWSRTNIKWHLRRLQEAGRIEYVGCSNCGSPMWKVIKD